MNNFYKIEELRSWKKI